MPGLNRRRGQYVPMDVYLDGSTMQRHFHFASAYQGPERRSDRRRDGAA